MSGSMQNDNPWTRRGMLRVLVAAGVGICLVSGCARETAPALAYNRSNADEIRRLMQEGAATTAGAEQVATAEPDGWATLTGRFTINGSPPPRAPLSITKDVEVCAPAGHQTLDESVVVGPDSGIQNVLIYLDMPLPSDDSKWLHESYVAIQSGEVLFDQKNCVFVSHVAGMWVTQRLKVLNSDPVGHNTNLDSKRGAKAENFLVPAFGSAYYDPGRPSPAPFPVSCSIHPWMTAWMMVCESPYFAITAPDGSFSIKNLPSGVPLQFRVWQEKANYLQQVSVNGEAKKWSRGRFELTLAKDEETSLAVAVDSAIFR
jgi:hypothetical protein